MFSLAIVWRGGAVVCHLCSLNKGSTDASSCMFSIGFQHTSSSRGTISSEGRLSLIAIDDCTASFLSDLHSKLFCFVIVTTNVITLGHFDSFSISVWAQRNSKLLRMTRSNDSECHDGYN